ncbi:formylglycine-generating enzyme family protein [Pacificimonas sp. ICDLI1SI03]
MSFKTTTSLSFLAALMISACASETTPSADSEALTVENMKSCPSLTDTPIRLAGGEFVMGQDDIYPEEGPERETRVDAFWIDPHEVTNRQFANFVDETGHITLAEKPVDPNQFGVPADQIPPHMLEPGSAVFSPPQSASRDFQDWWAYVPGANWRKPAGPTGPDAKPNEPVVHLAWEDMVAYARWTGGRLPTEAEWEYAAKGGNPSNSTRQPSSERANSWQGAFPVQNEATDGFKGVAPVGCFKPNGFGLYDMVGNVWEVTADFYAAGHNPADRDNPRGPSETSTYDGVNSQLATRVMKGGSYLCAPNYCQRYRPAARQGVDPGLGSSNVGFRLVYDRMPDQI